MATKTRRSRSANSNRRGISRIDQESTRTHGWFVRVGYYEDKQGTYRARHTKFFGDVGNGGKTKALAAAERFVRQVSRRKKSSKK